MVRRANLCIMLPILIHFQSLLRRMNFLELAHRVCVTVRHQRSGVILYGRKCYLRAGMTDNDHAGVKGCGTACVNAGNPIGLLTAEGKYYTLVIPAPQVAEHVGQTLRASGTIKSGSLVPDQLEMKEGGSWKEVKIDLT